MTNIEEVEVTFDDVNDFARHYFDEVSRIGRLVHKERGVVESDDITQGIWETVMRDFESSFAGIPEKDVLARLRRVGRQYVAKESLSLMHFAGVVAYTPEMVRQILESGGLPGDNEFEDIDSRIDVRGALNNLPPAQRKAVTKRYQEGVRHKDLSRAEQSNVQRGVTSITHYLNRGIRATVVSLDDEKGLRDSI